jgi:imidazolonepropionase-like amidohydrolase
MTQRTWLIGVGMLALAGALHAQRPEDRRRWTDSTTTTTDDPRRVPMPAPQRSGRVLVLRGGRVFDGTGAPARPLTVVIEENRIARLLPPGASGWATSAEVLDVTGTTVLPGLIDLHTHLTYTEPGLPPDPEGSEADATLRGVERLRFYLESGITSLRDVASAGNIPFRLKEWSSQGRVPAPRVFVAGQLITGTGGHGAELAVSPDYRGNAVREASGPDDWREAVREQFKRGADLIKIASHFSPAEAAAAVAEAHHLGLRVTCDCEGPYVEMAVDAGVDMIEHPLPRSEVAIRNMAERKVASVPTLVPYDYIFDLAGGYWGSSSRRFTFSKADNLEMLRRLRQAGVVIGVGTDLVVDWFRFLPAPYLTELGHLVSAGMTLPEALVAATAVNARLLDMGDRLGTLEPGKLADVLVVQGEPDRRLADLANVRHVVVDGRLAVRDGQVIVPRHVPKSPPKPSNP